MLRRLTSDNQVVSSMTFFKKSEESEILQTPTVIDKKDFADTFSLDTAKEYKKPNYVDQSGICSLSKEAEGIALEVRPRHDAWFSGEAALRACRA